MKPATMEKLVAVAGTLSGFVALVGCAAYVLGNPVAIVGAATGIIMTAVCAGCLAGMQIGRNMVPAPQQVVAAPEAVHPVTPTALTPAYAAPAYVAPAYEPPAPVQQPRFVPVRPLRYDALPVRGPVETPMSLPVVKLPPTSGTFEMSKAHIDALNDMCEGASASASRPTVEIDPSDLKYEDLPDSFATIPMKIVETEDGERIQMLQW